MPLGSFPVQGGQKWEDRQEGEEEAEEEEGKREEEEWSTVCSVGQTLPLSPLGGLQTSQTTLKGSAAHSAKMICNRWAEKPAGDQLS